MYAKVNLGDDKAAVLISVANIDTLRPQLIAEGWDSIDDQSAWGELRIGLNGLQLVVRDQLVLTDDANPVSPPGWWQLVNARDRRAICIIFAEGALDLRDAASLSAGLDAVMDTDHSITAWINVVEDL